MAVYDTGTMSNEEEEIENLRAMRKKPVHNRTAKKSGRTTTFTPLTQGLQYIFDSTSITAQVLKSYDA